MKSHFGKTLVLVFGLTLVPASGLAQSLSPKEVVQRVLEVSYPGRQIKATLGQKEVWESRAKAPYGIQVDAKTTYELARIEAISGLNNPEDRTFLFGVGLKKQFSTGTRLGVDYERIQQTSVLNPFFATLRPPSVFQDSFGLELSQPLLKDGFGRATRREVEAAKLQSSNVALEVLEKQEELALQALDLFWNGVVSERQIAASEAALKEYEKLAKTVARRADVNFVDPGEQERVNAEYEIQKQQVAQARLVRTQLTRQLVNLLRLDEAPTELVHSSEIQEQKFSPQKIESTRAFQVAENRSLAAASQAEAAASKGLPELDVFGGVRYFGLEGTSGAALSELTSGNRPRYQVGLRLAWDLERNLARGEIAEARVKHQQALLDKARVQSDLKVEEANALSELETRIELARSAKKLVQLRERGIRAVVKSYRQGRTDLDSVVGAVTAKVAAEVQESRAIANYHMGVVQLHALQDSLFK